MDINLNGIIIIVGNYGSGKTEVAINLAVDRKNAGLDVRLADLDLVNPYFRTREARAVLARLGVDLVIPTTQYLQADLPMLIPQIAGMIRRPSELTLLDVGGDEVGATVLASLADVFKGQKPRMLQVVNPFRPYTDTVAGCAKIGSEIEAASKLPIDGIIGNANLIDETEPEHIYDGYKFVQKYAKQSGLPLEFITLAADMLTQVDVSAFNCPVLNIRRQLVPPWKKATRFNGEK
jgi:hypothetical protein